MRINKLTIIGAVIIISVVAVVFFVSNSGTSSTPPSQSVVPTPPIYQGRPAANANVAFSLESSFSLPQVEDWNQYSVTTQNYKALADSVVQRLTTKTTQVTTTAGGDEVTSWSWGVGEASLSISQGSIATFSFTDSSPLPGGLSLTTLTSALSLPAGISITPVTPPAQVQGAIHFPYDQSLGQIFRSTLAYTYKGYPLLLSGPDEQSLVLFTEQGGRIRHASILLPMNEPSFVKPVVAIKTQDVLPSLNQNKGLFVTSDINGAWENDDTASFNKMTVKTSRPARLLNNTTMTLEPVFILDGEETSQTGPKTVRYIIMGYLQ